MQLLFLYFSNFPESKVFFIFFLFYTYNNVFKLSFYTNQDKIVGYETSLIPVFIHPHKLYVSIRWFFKKVGLTNFT